MKENKIQVIGCFFAIAILVIMMCYTIGSKAFSHLKKDETISSVNVKWDELYPFEELSKSTEKKSLVEKYEEYIKKVENLIESDTSKNLIGYEKFIELSYIYNDLISYKLVSNSSENARIEIEDGYFSRLVKKKNDTTSLDKLIEFNEYLKEKGVDLLYVQAPYKIGKNQNISSIYKDYSNENMDNFLSAIEGKINYIDLRENINENNLNNLPLFYRTDHHWLPETGLWATKEISNYLNDNYEIGLEIDNINPEKYNKKKYERMYLGSDGRYVSLKNATPEDFTLITPNFNTKLDVKILDKGVDKKDTFENTLIDWSKIKYDNYYKISQYEAYVYGTRPLIEIHNELVHNNKKILLVRDSFSQVVIPFMALENEYLSAIDLRHFDGSLKNYISQYNPDIVIVMYTGNIITDSDETSASHKALWMFE